jgi:NADH-quinone oxidoreductase subunit C/D
MSDQPSIIKELQSRFGTETILVQTTQDAVPTVWIGADRVGEVLRHLKREISQPYRMLYDLTAIDERARQNRPGQPDSDFTVVYQLMSFDRNEYLRIKVALRGESPSVRTITDLWPSADWYECELWDMFGISVAGHPHLRRILMPPWWKGHPLRKDHPARATDMTPFTMPEDQYIDYEKQLEFHPKDWGLAEHVDNADLMFLNFGPQHPSTHGILRLVVQLDGEQIVHVVPDIGYHHRGAEKMGERQSWHTYIPYTDRVDYLGGVVNNLA